MELDFTYWQGTSGYLVGYLNMWPDHPTQGKDLPELEEALTEMYEFYKEQHAETSVELKLGKLKVLA
jgi:predicted RNase H-like HicB family nuclease